MEGKIKMSLRRVMLFLPLLLDQGTGFTWNGRQVPDESSNENQRIQNENFVHRSSRSGYELECPYPYQKVGDMCLFARCILDDYKNYPDSRIICQTTHDGDLAIFTDANQWNNIQRYLETVNPYRNCSYWLGGSDEANEGNWLWNNGERVPLGVPFWATQSGGLALHPRTNTGFNHLLLSDTDQNLLIDENFGIADVCRARPLCQYTPQPYGHQGGGYYPH